MAMRNQAGSIEYSRMTQDLDNGRANGSKAAMQRGWWLAALLVVGVFLAYQPVWHAGFIWDDDEFLTDNPVLKSANGLYRAWFTASTLDYYPMTFSLFWFEWRIWGKTPLGYHLVYRFIKTFTHYIANRSNFFQRCTTGAALISAMPSRILSLSSALDLTRICRKKVWAIFPKSVSTKFSQEPCLGV